MANRFPLVVDSSNYRVEELPSGDNVDLTGSGIVNAGSVAIAGSTISSSTTTGALTVAGGVGIGSSAFFGADIFITSANTHIRVGSGNYTPGATTPSSTPVQRTNVAIGQGALESNTTGYNNVAIGPQAGRSITSGSANVLIGELSGQGIGTGLYNTGVGQGTLQNAASNSEANTAIGFAALRNVTTGGANVAVGDQAGLYLTTGTENTFVGSGAGFAVTTSSTRNTALGQEALRSFVGPGDINTALGEASCSNLIAGDANVAVGERAMYFFPNTGICTGNVSIGVLSGMGFTNRSNYNIALGYNSLGTVLDPGTQNNIVIGYDANVSAATTSNEITLGNSSIVKLRCQVTTITSLSDERDKKDIEDISLGLDYINEVRPVKFVWNQRDGGRIGIPEVGFIAQELKAVTDKYNAGWLNIVSEENPDKLEASPGKLLPILVKAVQELSAKNAELETRLAALEAK